MATDRGPASPGSGAAAHSGWKQPVCVRAGASPAPSAASVTPQQGPRPPDTALAARVARRQPSQPSPSMCHRCARGSSGLEQECQETLDH